MKTIIFSSIDKHDCTSFSSCSCSSSNSVHVTFWIVRNIIIDNKIDLIHIKSSCSNISSYENINLVIFYRIECLKSFSLFHVTMQRIDGKLVHLETFSKIVCSSFGFGKDKNLKSLIDLCKTFQDSILVTLIDLHKHMVDRVDNYLTFDLDMLVVGSNKLTDKAQHLFWKRCTIRQDLFDHRLIHCFPNFLDRFNKSHIEHSINLIEYKIFDVFGFKVSLFDQVIYSSWRSYNDLWSFFKFLDLPSF